MNKIYVKTKRGKILRLDLDRYNDRIFYGHYKNNPFLDDFEQEDIIIKEAKTKEELEK